MVGASNAGTLRDTDPRQDYGFRMLPRSPWGLPPVILMIVLLAFCLPVWAQSCGIGATPPPPPAMPPLKARASQPPGVARASLPGSSSGNTSLSNGLLSYWKLDDASGTSAADSMGSNTGTWSGTLGSQWATGRINGGGNFDGSTNYVNVGSASALNFERNNAFSAGGWIKTTSGNARSIVGKMQQGGSFTGWNLELYGVAPVGRVAFYLINSYSGNAIQVHTSSVVSDGNWHFVLVTYTGTSNASGVTLYVDGVSQTIAVDYNSLTSSILNALPVYVGARVGGEFFSGSIDEVGIWNRALTASEVSTLYHSGSGNPFGNSSCGFSY